MPRYECKDFRECVKLIIKHQADRDKRIRLAVEAAARHGRRYIVSHTLPIAFRTLEKSLRVVSSRDLVQIITDAPHAASVETGSRPHWPPLGPLIRWVKLRGMQGLGGRRRAKPGPRSLRGTTTKTHSENIADTLKRMEQNNSLAIDAPEQIARAIQVSISRYGTEPHWYMLKALPEVVSNLDVQIKQSIGDK